MERVVECWHGGNIHLADLAGHISKWQQFYFDGVSKTIKSAQWRDRSLNIEGNGKSSNLYMRGTNSRWF
jgi:hypothetical protein